MLSYSNLFQEIEQLDNNERETELWDGANKKKLLPPELELESRIIASNDNEILQAKKITDEYKRYKKEIKELNNACKSNYALRQGYLIAKKKVFK